jgi:excisionase family DNA binding protein
VEKIYFSVNETAEILGIGVRAIYNSIHKGSVRKFIRPHWFGRKPLFHRGDIQAYADSLPTEREVVDRCRIAGPMEA